jgi:hypothetical protein
VQLEDLQQAGIRHLKKRGTSVQGFAAYVREGDIARLHVEGLATY